MKLIRNLDLLVMIVAAVVLALLNIPYIRDLTGIDLSRSTDSMFLFALAILTNSILQDRKVRRGLLDKLDPAEIGAIQDSLPPSLSAEIKKSERVMLIGVSGLSYIQEFLTTVEAKLDDGDELNVLVTDPECGFVAIAASRDQNKDVDYQRDRILETIRIIDTVKGRGTVRLKRTSAPIDGDYIVLYSSGNIRKIYYKHYGYKTRLDSSLCLHIDESLPDCFAYFKRHIENLWEYAS